MRIITKQKDYFDRGMAHGIDMSVVYIRSNIELDYKAIPKEVQDVLRPSCRINEKKANGSEVTFDAFTVVFCGKVYRGIKAVRVHYSSKDLYGIRQEEVKCFYNFDEMKDYLAQFEMTLSEKEVIRQWRWGETTMNVKAWLTKQGTDELMNFVIENRFVTLTITKANWDPQQNREWEVMANGYLDRFQFFRVFDAYSAFQEVDMFVSGTLPQSTAMPINISDEDRIKQHGFDKFSFRKGPETNKK